MIRAIATMALATASLDTRALLATFAPVLTTVTTTVIALTVPAVASPDTLVSIAPFVAAQMIARGTVLVTSTSVSAMRAIQDLTVL